MGVCDFYSYKSMYLQKKPKTNFHELIIKSPNKQKLDVTRARILDFLIYLFRRRKM